MNKKIDIFASKIKGFPLSGTRNRIYVQLISFQQRLVALVESIR